MFTLRLSTLKVIKSFGCNGGKGSQFTPEPCSVLSDTIMHAIWHSQVMFIHIKNASGGAGVGSSQLLHQPTLWTLAWSCLALPQELWLSFSILLSFYDNKCYGNYFYHWAKSHIQEKQQPGWKPMVAFPKHRESSTLSSCTIISLARSKGVVLNRTATGGWTAMRPVKSKLQELGCQCENYQSSPEKKSSNQDPWPSIHSRVFQPQTGVSVSLVSMRVSVCVCACWVTQSHPTLLRPPGLHCYR